VRLFVDALVHVVGIVEVVADMACRELEVYPSVPFRMVVHLAGVRGSLVDRLALVGVDRIQLVGELELVVWLVEEQWLVRRPS